MARGLSPIVARDDVEATDTADVTGESPNGPVPASTPRTVGGLADEGPAPSSRGNRWSGVLGQSRGALLAAISLALFIVLWHILTHNRLPLYVRFNNVPSPEAVLTRILAVSKSRAFATDVLLSCRRIFLGFGIAAIVAVPLGMIMGRFRLARELVFPLVEVFRPIPAIAWVPMAIMIWPSNEESIVFITFLGSFFPILLNTLSAMKAIDPVLIRAARSLGASEGALFREVYFPACLPSIFTGLAVGMGVAWVSLIAAEMISGQFGIGYFTWEAYSLVEYADIALGMISIGVLGLLSSALVRLLGYALMPWAR